MKIATGPFDIYAFRPNKRNAINTLDGMNLTVGDVGLLNARS